MLANAVIAVLVIGSLFALIFDKEYWPFSPYPMYSTIYDDNTITGVRLYGVTQEEPHREILLRNSDYLQPFSPYRSEAALSRIDSKEDPERRQRLREKALRDFLKRYEELRLAERHDGPPIQGVRLYEVRWQLDRQAQTLYQPDHRELIDEVEQRRR